MPRGSRVTVKQYTDHQYMGNVCSGLGGSIHCKHMDYETGKRCGLTPYEHNYREPGVHKSDTYDRDAEFASVLQERQTGMRYEGQHVA